MNRENKLVRETLVSRDQRFFGHFGGHQIALGRFIVTSYGGVIDIQAKKVILDEQDGKLLGLEEEKRRSVYHNGKLIGQWVFNPVQSETVPGLLAFAYVQPDKNANLGYPDGVAV